jgi:putative copper resistance protein D
MSESSALIITTGGELLILAAASGAVIGHMWVLPAPASAAAPPLLAQLRRGLWRLLGLCVFMLAVTAALELVLRTANMSELPLRLALGEIGTVLHKTHYGRLWLWRAAAVLCLGIIWLIQWRHSGARLLPVTAFTALIVSIISLSASGHGGDNGLLSMANIANSLHILGALVWGGAIIAYALLILPGLMRDRQAATQSLLATSSLRLSSLAGIALAVTVVPGLYNAWSLVGSWHGLWSTLYGRLLVAKVILVTAMIALGAVNRYRYVPSLLAQAGRPPPRSLLPLPHFSRMIADSATAKYFLRSLKAEAFILLAVLSLAAMLSQEMPAAHVKHGKQSGHAHAGSVH